MRRGGCRPPRRGSPPTSWSASSCSGSPGGIASRDLRPSLPQHLDQHALVAAAVEFAVEDLLPRAEVELAARDRDHHLAAHDLPLVMRVPVVLAGAVVVVPLRAGIERRQLLEPAFVILVQAGLVVVDE